MKFNDQDIIYKDVIPYMVALTGSLRIRDFNNKKKKDLKHEAEKLKRAIARGDVLSDTEEPTPEESQ